MQHVGRYTLLERMASGPSSEVFYSTIRDPLPSGSVRGASCAVKIMKPRVVMDPEMVSTMLVELANAVSFHHPAAAQILEAQQDETDVYIAMELAEGQTLERALS